MSFVCSIHGYYAPPAGATIAICPSCSAQTYGSVAPRTRELDLRGALECLCVAIEVDTGRGFEQSRDVEDALAAARKALG